MPGWGSWYYFSVLHGHIYSLFSDSFGELISLLPPVADEDIPCSLQRGREGLAGPQEYCFRLWAILFPVATFLCLPRCDPP